MDDPTAALGPWPPPNNPLRAAHRVLGSQVEQGAVTLRFWRQSWWRWSGAQWRIEDDLQVSKLVAAMLDVAVYLDEKQRPQEWGSTRRRVSDVLACMRETARLPDALAAPFWLPEHEHPGSIPAARLVACSNGLLDIGTRVLYAHTPHLFNLAASPYAYDPRAPRPDAWLAALGAQWGDDPSSIAALQEILGYLLSGRTDLHKAFLLQGPPRSLKGTILRVAENLVGPENVGATSPTSLCGEFGLESLEGKSVAVMGDADFPRKSSRVVELVKSISGGDVVPVNRKGKKVVTARLPLRFLIAANDLLSVVDASGAFLSRLVVLVTTQSFLGREDPSLGARIDAEGAAILLWSLDGLTRLGEQRRFTVPISGAEHIREMRHASSPVAAFVEERCVLGPDCSADKLGLLNAYRDWCVERGRTPGSDSALARNLYAAFPTVASSRPRVGEAREYRFVGIRLRSTLWDGGELTEPAE